MGKISIVITPTEGEKYPLILSHIEHNDIHRTTVLGEDLQEIETIYGGDEETHVNEVLTFVRTLGHPSSPKHIEADQATRNYFAFIRGI